MADNSNHQHHQPKWILVPSNAVTTWQIVNIGCLAVWTILLYLNGDVYERSRIFEALKGITPSIGWWTGITSIFLICNLLPIVRWWATHVNRTYRTKFTGLSLSAFWWGYIAMMFAVGQGFDLGFGIHAVLAAGSVYEAFRLVRGRV